MQLSYRSCERARLQIEAWPEKSCLWIASSRYEPMAPLVVDTLNSWIHSFWAILRQLLIVSPHIGVVVVELRQEIMQL